MSLAKAANKLKEKPPPPGRIKIVQALKSLLEAREFSAITTAEIARSAGVTEALDLARAAGFQAIATFESRQVRWTDL